MGRVFVELEWLTDWVCLSSLQRWSMTLLRGFADPHNLRFSEAHHLGYQNFITVTSYDDHHINISAYPPFMDIFDHDNHIFSGIISSGLPEFIFLRSYAGHHIIIWAIEPSGPCFVFFFIEDIPNSLCPGWIRSLPYIIICWLQHVLYIYPVVGYKWHPW